MWILVKMILTKMMSCSRGGIHWSVALSASNDSSFATLNALNTSYIQYSIPELQYLMMFSQSNTWWLMLHLMHCQKMFSQYSIPDATFKALSENGNTSYNNQFLKLHSMQYLMVFQNVNTSYFFHYLFICWIINYLFIYISRMFCICWVGPNKN